MQLTKNFDSNEFRCHDGTPIPVELMPNVRRVAENLQILRDYLDEPIFVHSGHRTPVYNAKVGGKKKSKHLTGEAADITVKSKTPKQLAAIIEKLIVQGKMKQGGIGIYPGFVHYDTRGTRARW